MIIIDDSEANDHKNNDSGANDLNQECLLQLTYTKNLMLAYGNEAPSCAIVFRYFTEFRNYLPENVRNLVIDKNNCYLIIIIVLSNNTEGTLDPQLYKKYS